MTDDEFLSAANPLNMPSSRFLDQPCKIIIRKYDPVCMNEVTYDWEIVICGRQFTVRSRSQLRTRENALALATNVATEFGWDITEVIDDNGDALGPWWMGSDEPSDVGDFDPKY